MVQRRLCALCVCWLLAGCAGLPAAPGRALHDNVGFKGVVCLFVYDYLDLLVAHYGVGDAAAARVPGFPHLRVNRFLAAHPGRRTVSLPWLTALAELDIEARKIEISNLPMFEQEELNKTPVDGISDVDAITACGPYMVQMDLAAEGRRKAIRQAAEVPDNYKGWRRVAGLYPLTRLPVAWGYSRWRRKNLKPFGQGMDDLPVEGRLVDFAPPQGRPLSTTEVAEILSRDADNPLGVPKPDAATREALFAKFAPIWRLDVVTDDDRIGHPSLIAKTRGKNARITVDTRRPTTFTWISHTYFEGEALLQLNYGIWFSSRPRRGVFDMLGGVLDGVVWRLTLGRDGRPMIYDSMHYCGCYHLFFPVPPLVRRSPGGPSLDDPIVVAKAAPQLRPGERIVLRLASGSHYLVGVAVEDTDRKSIVYTLADGNDLRSLPLAGGGRKSLYAANGIVKGSERLERFTLWPMGIVSAGAMRQPGSHATAFVGRRHFDDPYLFEEAFTR